MKKQLQLLLFLFTLTVACKKVNTTLDSAQPQSTPIITVPVSNTIKGSLSGMISPAESISKITATLIQNGQKYTVQISSDGTFNASELPEGNYTLDYSPNDFHQKPSNTTLEIKQGVNTQVGTISPKQKSAPIACYVNGQYQSWSNKGYYSGSLLQLVRYLTGTGIPEQDIKMPLTYDLGITLSPFNGPGTYTCDPSTRSSLTYRLIRGGLPISIQDTKNANSSATVVITSIDPETRTITGTFSAFIAARSASANDAITITKGIINAKY